MAMTGHKMPLVLPQVLKLPMVNIARKLVEGLYNFTGSSVTLSCPSINKGVTFWLRSQALEPTKMCLLEINMIVKKKKKINSWTSVTHERLNTFCFHCSLVKFSEMTVKRFNEIHKNKVNRGRKDSYLIQEVRWKSREQENFWMEETRIWLFWTS